ncbi:RNA polymerase sigma factor [compost metagenome]
MLPFAQVPLKSPGNTAASAEEEAVRRLSVSEVWKHVEELPLKQREVLVLHAHYGLKDGEVAEMLGIPEGTVKSRLNAARKRMMLIMEREGTIL